jgi:hypothetical protein
MQQSARIAPLEKDGEIVGTITVIDDVTERVAREAKLRDQITALEICNRLFSAVESGSPQRCGASVMP